MSLLPTSTYAGPSEALWAVAGSVGPGGGVTQLFAGSGITLNPATGEGDVTISVTGGGGGGGVTSIVAGAGIGVSSPAGDVTVTNNGVTSLVAGTGITVSGATGAVTVNATPGNVALTSSTLAGSASFDPAAPTAVATNIVYINLSRPDAVGDPSLYQGYVSNAAFTNLDSYMLSVRALPQVALAGAAQPTGTVVTFSEIQTVPGSVLMAVSLGYTLAGGASTFIPVILTRIPRVI